MLFLSSLLAFPQRVFVSEPTGLEWMVIASILVPAVLLGVLIFLGRKSAV